mmetsp:Transcript_16276/g.38461  ORF Transcript_16276/g.38461 Transcript_16276/m.38461 type:complete len:219 (+) Transcript_16276:375-1031(+)
MGPVDHCHFLGWPLPQRLRVIGTQELNLSVLPLDHLVTCDDVAIPELHLSARRQSLEAGLWLLLEVLHVQEDLPTKVRLPHFVFWLAGNLDEFVLPFWPVCNGHAQRAEHAEQLSGHLFLKNIPHDVFEKGIFDHTCGNLRHSDELAQLPQSRWRVPASPHAGDRRHTGVIPTLHIATLHQSLQFSLRHHNVGHLQSGKLVLPWQGGVRRLAQGQRPR